MIIVCTNYATSWISKGRSKPIVKNSSALFVAKKYRCFVWFLANLIFSAKFEGHFLLKYFNISNFKCCLSWQVCWFSSNSILSTEHFCLLCCRGASIRCRPWTGYRTIEHLWIGGVPLIYWCYNNGYYSHRTFCSVNTSSVHTTTAQCIDQFAHKIVVFPPELYAPHIGLERQAEHYTWQCIVKLSIEHVEAT